MCVYCLNFYHYTFIRELPCVVFSPPGIYLDILKHEMGRKVKLFPSANKKKKKYLKTGIKSSRQVKPENVS